METYAEEKEIGCGLKFQSGLWRTVSITEVSGSQMTAIQEVCHHTAAL